MDEYVGALVVMQFVVYSLDEKYFLRRYHYHNTILPSFRSFYANYAYVRSEVSEWIQWTLAWISTFSPSKSNLLNVTFLGMYAKTWTSKRMPLGILILDMFHVCRIRHNVLDRGPDVETKADEVSKTKFTTEIIGYRNDALRKQLDNVIFLTGFLCPTKSLMYTAYYYLSGSFN